LVLVNTNKGKQVFEDIRKQLIVRESNVIDCLQPQLKYPSEVSPNRGEFWNDYEAKGYEYVIKKYAGYNFKNMSKAAIRNLLDEMGLLDTVRKLRR